MLNGIICLNNPVNFVDPNGEDWISSGLTVIGSVLIFVPTTAVWTTVGIVVTVGSITYSGYQYLTGEETGQETTVSVILQVGSGIPYPPISIPFHIGEVAWEVVHNVDEANNPCP